MTNSNHLFSRINAESEHFVPDAKDVVSPAILAQAFGSGPLPFPTNSDGSVSANVYRAYLEATWLLALEEADAAECETEELGARFEGEAA